MNRWLQLPQAPRCSYERATRAQSRYKMCNSPARLLPNLVGGCPIVRLPIGRIAVLIRVKILLRIGSNNLVNSPDRAVRALITRSDNQFGPKSAKDAFALVRGAVRQAKFHRIAKRRCDRGIRDPRIPAGSIDNRLAGPQCAAR